jgi:K+-sensing histidine kinase KdpD
MHEKDQTMLIQELANQEQRLLVAVSSSQISAQLARQAHHLSPALKCWGGPVYVETSSSLCEADQWMVVAHARIAALLGG